MCYCEKIISDNNVYSFLHAISLLKLRTRTESIRLTFTMKEKLSLERTFKGYLVQASDESSAKFAVSKALNLDWVAQGIVKLSFEYL